MTLAPETSLTQKAHCDIQIRSIVSTDSMITAGAGKLTCGFNVEVVKS
jgi:hypothetical protein